MSVEFVQVKILDDLDSFWSIEKLQYQRNQEMQAVKNQPMLLLTALPFCKSLEPALHQLFIMASCFIRVSLSKNIHKWKVLSDFLCLHLLKQWSLNNTLLINTVQDCRSQLLFWIFTPWICFSPQFIPIRTLTAWAHDLTKDSLPLISDLISSLLANNPVFVTALRGCSSDR